MQSGTIELHHQRKKPEGLISVTKKKVKLRYINEKFSVIFSDSSGLDMSLTTDSTQTLPVSSAHQVVTVTADDKQNGEQDVLNGNAENEQGNVEKSSLTLITSDREKVTKTESKQENALPVKLRSKHVRICAEAIEASISKETTRNEKISTSKGKSRAVSAPEVEILDEKTNPESEDNSVGEQ